MRREVRIGHAGTGRGQGGERLLGAAAYGGKGCSREVRIGLTGKGRAQGGGRPMGAAAYVGGGKGTREIQG